LLHHAAPVVKYQLLDNSTALIYVVIVSNVLFFADAFDELTDKITQFISIMCLSFSYKTM